MSINTTCFQKNDLVVPVCLGNHLFRFRNTLTAKVIRVNPKSNTVTLDFKIRGRAVQIPAQPMLSALDYKEGGLPLHFAIHAADYKTNMFKSI